MKKILWSISTTVRNPERIIDFLRVLKQLEGADFKEKTQMKFQILLIKERLYSPMNIPTAYKDLFNDVTKEIPYNVAEKVFHSQDYQDPPMRGRQSANPLNKLGFSIAKDTMGKIRITSLGNLYLSPDADVGYIFFKSLLKLQFPNPMSTDFSEKKGFNIQPLVAAMHLMKRTGGLSQTEFSLFVPTLIDYRDIDKHAQYVSKFRKLTPKEKDDFIVEFLKKFYGVTSLTDKQKDNPFEYGDNSMRYFRLTKYFRVIKNTFGHWSVDLEPSRNREIEQLLALYNGSAKRFARVEDYIEYISDISKPILPWETDYVKSKEVVTELMILISKYFASLSSSLQLEVKQRYEALITIKLEELDLNKMRRFIEDLRALRLELIQIGRDRSLRKNLDELRNILLVFKDRKRMQNVEPVEFEYMISQCLKILNDEINIKPNCILDDEGKPIGFAPGNRADIEGYYASFNSIFEATLDVSRNQVYRESMPVMRHLKDFENKNSDKPAFCIFISPKVHDDTINYFWVSVKHGFEGRKQKIIAFELAHFVEILECFISIVENNKPFNHKNLQTLLESIVSDADSKDSSVNWFRDVSLNIKRWEKSLV